MRELYLIILTSIIVISCNNTKENATKSQGTLSEDQMPYTYPIIVNHKDSIIIGEKFLIKATTNNDYIFRLAKQNEKQNYLQARYSIGLDCLKVYNSYNPSGIAQINGDTALVEVVLPENQGDVGNKYFCRVNLIIDFSDKYPESDTTWPVVHTFNIKRKKE